MTEFHPILPDELLFRGRELRKNSTFPERRLWNAIRGGRLCGLKFRRQHAIGPFFADYYCHEQRLVIELDGASHNDQGRYDLDREEYLRAQDLRVIRFTNDQVLHDLESVVRAILVACGRDPDTGSPIPFGEGGEGVSRKERVASAPQTQPNPKDNVDRHLVNPSP